MTTKPRQGLVALIPAYNEAESIAATIEAVLAQTRPADHVVVILNGCTDETATIARRYPVTVMELPRLPHRKSEALNTAGWPTPSTPTPSSAWTLTQSSHPTHSTTGSTNSLTTQC